MRRLHELQRQVDDLRQLSIDEFSNVVEKSRLTLKYTVYAKYIKSYVLRNIVIRVYRFIQSKSNSYKCTDGSLFYSITTSITRGNFHLPLIFKYMEAPSLVSCPKHIAKSHVTNNAHIQLVEFSKSLNMPIFMIQCMEYFHGEILIKRLTRN